MCYTLPNTFHTFRIVFETKWSQMFVYFKIMLVYKFQEKFYFKTGSIYSIEKNCKIDFLCMLLERLPIILFMWRNFLQTRLSFKFQLFSPYIEDDIFQSSRNLLDWNWNCIISHVLVNQIILHNDSASLVQQEPAHEFQEAQESRRPAWKNDT